MDSITILGAGSWGTALAVTLANKGWPVRLWCRNSEQKEQMILKRENIKYLPGVVLPPTITIHDDLEEVLSKPLCVVMSVPTNAVRNTLKIIKPLINSSTIIVNTAKGIEIDSLQRLSQVFEEEVPGISERFCVLSGPSHAEEVGRGVPTAVVAASTKRIIAEKVQDIFISPKFRVYTNPDVVGVEIGGALKNVIALATGISDGLGYGDNSRAALITRGMTEIARLGVKMGANPLTFAGLSGIGDLVVTCNSMHSRNRRAGIALGQGKELKMVLEEMGMVVEGVNTTRCIRKFAEKFEVDLPISQEVYNILFKGVNPREGVVNLMTRMRTHEMEDIVLQQVQW